MRGIKTGGRVEGRGHEWVEREKGRGKWYYDVLIKGKIYFTKTKGNKKQ